MHTLLFCFANDAERLLENLRVEKDGIDDRLAIRHSRGEFNIVSDYYATTDKVARKLSIYRDSLAIFHFSGHAGQSILHLDDGVARGEGIARLLGRCPNLQLFF